MGSYAGMTLRIEDVKRSGVWWHKARISSSRSRMASWMETYSRARDCCGEVSSGEAAESESMALAIDVGSYSERRSSLSKVFRWI